MKSHLLKTLFFANLAIWGAVSCGNLQPNTENQGQPAGSNTTPSTSSAKAITYFAFPTIPAVGAISGTNITVAVPAGTNVTALRPVILIDGASVTVANAAQTSGITANNFTSPVVYTVHAQDGSTANYTVTVTLSNSLKSITYFNFPNLGGVSTISGNNITVSVPYGTNLTNLVAVFTHNGASVRVGATTQTSGVTTNNFSSAVTYRVTAQDASFSDYTVQVNADLPTKEITAYSFGSFVGRISGNDITIDVPYGTNVINVTPIFQYNGISIKINNTPQVSNSTQVDLSTPKVYTVTAHDGTTRDYTVTANVGQNSAKEITAFSIPALNAIGIINGNAITVNVPNGTPVTNLVATFSTTGSSVRVGVTPQTSSVTANNFSSPVTYTVTAADNSTQTYTVTVNVASASDKSIELFTFNAAGVTGTLSGTNITATVPFGTNISNLVATFSTTGLKVKVNGVTQTSGITPNNFSVPVVYTIEAADGTLYSYTVTLTVAPPSSAASIAYFTFTTTSDFGLFNGTNIAVRVPNGTDLTNLVPIFKINGHVVRVNGVTQFSGVTANNFSAPVVYSVQAQDGTIVNYTVTVTTVAYDVFAPQITAVTTMTTSTSSYPATVTVRVYYTETGSGIGTANSISLCSPTRLVTFSSGTSLGLSLPFVNQGSYLEGTFTLQSYHESGIWKVCNISINDLAGNWMSLSINSSTSTTNYTRYINSNAVDSGVAIGGGVNVTGTTQDITPPAITSVTLSPGSTSSYPATVTVRVYYTETGSGIGTANSISLCSPTRLVTFSSGTSLGLSLPFVNQGSYLEGTFTLQSYHESGIWKVCNISINDLAGNWMSLSINSSTSTTNYTRYINSNAVDSGVAIGGGVNVTGTTQDITPPAITSVTLSPGSTSSYPATVTVRVYYTETGSGIGTANSISLCSPTRLVTFSSGTSLGLSLPFVNQGSYLEGTFTLQSYHESGIWKVCNISINDLAGNWMSLSINSSTSTTNYTRYINSNAVDSGVAIGGGVNKQ